MSCEKLNCNNPKIPRGKYCENHRSKNKSWKRPTCQSVGCKTQPVYGAEGSGKPEYCKTHAPKEYVDVKNTTCIHPNCKTQPSYGAEGSGKAEYCKTHAPKEYVDVKNTTCIHPNCKTRPVYGAEGSGKAEYCKTHAPKEYVNVKDKTCIHPNCKTQPVYGAEGSGKAEYCKEHKPQEYVDVKSKTCIHPNCKTRPWYGFPTYSATHCAKHKSPNMVQNPSKVKDGEYNKCQICDYKIDPKDEYCGGCKLYIDYGSTVKYREKEMSIASLLDDNKIEYTHDLTVKDGCSRKRPDFVINTSWGVVILEIDEFQHRRNSYSCECEITRMKQLYFDIGVENVLFIRYNPDSYKPLTGKAETIVKRKEYLLKYIEDLKKDREYFTGLGVVYLYYDGFERSSVQIETINPYC